ncbi:MAG: phosphate-starvation-inducible PsiE family protein [Sulfurimicrobium sp.]|nr:phosphate-starvation-inducible PsiE family protein [Sulfurimicrobium sp.]MDP1705092.1 phosphate-starvation-inducible PsiE family protein [Sulfurimicrobium sp.]MDP2198734.1 phosphate-starvation-inducible PsiE family protein [Sulfurimicrobium sp.]MDP3686354.1 phosphate-starvation-inducible PsiE family protein [Sulfurimicrobium sp.]MDZ7656183.1 phosphate-starvation-inducible PsiE family protein [Sulfurimicrobium sp.]
MIKKPIQEFNKWLLSLVEHIGLLIIAIATVFAMGSEVMVMVRAGQVTLADLLLLFLYLEVLAMVGLYYRTGKLPVRFPLYIGMVALARYLILDMKAMDDWRMLAVSGSILMLTMAVLMIRFGHVRYPYPGDEQVAESHNSDQTKS